MAEGAVKGRSPGSARDIRSLRDDVQSAVAAVGPALAHHLASLENPLRREVGRLGELLKDPAAAALPTTTARAALGLLSEPVATANAWDDLVEAWRTGAKRTVCAQRQAILEDLLERAGLDPEWELDLARDVLMNRGWGLILSGGVLGEPFAKDSEGFEIALELPDRLERVRRFLTEVLGWRTRTVWFAFTGAALGIHMVSVGPVQFFGAKVLDAPAGEQVPPELRRLDERAPHDEDELSRDPFE